MELTIVLTLLVVSLIIDRAQHGEWLWTTFAVSWRMDKLRKRKL